MPTFLTFKTFISPSFTDSVCRLNILLNIPCIVVENTRDFTFIEEINLFKRLNYQKYVF